MTPATSLPTAAEPAACCARCGPSCGCAVPRCLDLSLCRPSERGRYRAELVPDARPIPLHAPAAWTLRLHVAAARPVADATLEVDGGMPQRGLRFAVPVIVRPAAAGAYRLEGPTFTAPGWWLLRLTITAAAGADTVVFNLGLD
jgi:hypothetical protein